MIWGILAMMIWLLPRPVLAAELIFNLDGGEYVAGNEYNINYQATGLTGGEQYYSKIFGSGIRMINGSNLLSSNDAWNLFPIISANSNGEASGSAKFKAVDGAKNYDITFKLAKVSNTDSQVSSLSQTVTMVAPTPTITPTSSPSPTPSQADKNFEIRISAIPGSAYLGQNFEIKVLIENGNKDYEYYVKVYGGYNDNYGIETYNIGSWWDFNSSWNNLPKLKTNQDGRVEGVIKVRVKSDKESGAYLVGVKAREWSGTKEADSGKNKTVLISKAPSATATSKPTPSPTIEVPPTLEPTPSETAISLTPASANIGDDDLSVVISPTPSLKKQVKMATVLPIAFIVGGGLMVAIPLIIGKIKR